MIKYKNNNIANISKIVNKFEILSEEDEEIDIQAIEEFEIGGCNVKMGDTWVSTESLVNDMLLDKTNRLIKAVKQLDEKINKGE